MDVRSMHGVEGSESLAAAIDSGAIYVSGHFTMDQLLEANRDLTPYKLVTNIRNPVDRFFSDVNYHVEILSRGNDFYMFHSPPIRVLIAQTYLALRDAQQGKASSLSHLFDVFLRDFYARRVLSKASIDALLSTDVEDAMRALKGHLTPYYWIGNLEKNGADQLLRITCEELGLNPAAGKSNHNKSRNFANPEVFRNEIQDYLMSGNSHATNLLYLNLSGASPERISGMSWADLSTYAIRYCIENSTYQPASFHPLPEIDFELEI
jgi:hypothetical protein